MLGNHDAAAQSLRLAIEYLQKALAAAQAAVSTSQGKNLSAVQDLVHANKFLSFAFERAGDLKASLQYREAQVAAAKILVAADSRTPLSRMMIANSSGAAVRLRWLIDPHTPASPSALAVGGACR